MKRIILDNEAITLMVGMKANDLKKLVESFAGMLNGKGINVELPTSVRLVLKGLEKKEVRHKSYEKNKGKPKKVVTPIPQTQGVPNLQMAVRYPTTAEEVQSIAANACKKMTREDAEMYLACRQSLNWHNANGQCIQNIGADIRMWALKAQNGQRASLSNAKPDYTKHFSGDYTEVL